MERGVFDSVDVPASTFLHEWRDDGRKDITLRHLFTMSSGLKPLSPKGGMASAAVRFFTDGPAARSTLLGRPLLRQPGTHFSYSNADSQTVGLMLERATGRPYQDLLSEYLWKPIGADDAHVWLNEPDGFPRTFTPLLARPRDWLRVGLLIKDSGKFLGEQVIDEQLVVAMIAPSSTEMGYGWQIWRGADRVPTRYYNADRVGLNVAQSEPFMGNDWVFLDDIGGQRVYISRAADLVIVRLGQLRRDWDDSQLPNRVTRALDNADNR
ncbi:MAG: serine hydrolase domain-containing protein [Lysobacterales bacterium]